MIATDVVFELLTKASAGRGAILTRRECVRFDSVPVSELMHHLRQVGHHVEGCQGRASTEILGIEEGALGHAPAWIDAGLVYEDLARSAESLGSLDYVFCLDPWAAQLRSRAGEIAGHATWILVSDIDDRNRAEEREYWEQLQHWFQGLSFSAIIPKRVWDQALVAPEAPAPPAPESTLFAQKPGAWRWRRLTPGPGTASVVALIRYSGRLAHLRVLLDSLIRQEGSREGMRLVVLAGAEGEDPRATLRWFEIAHPAHPIALIRTSEEWKTELNRVLSETPGATVVMIGDHAILPARFLDIVRQGAHPPVLGVPVNLEATAHIVTGNLDPIQNYDTLLQSFMAHRKTAGVSARIIPPNAWKDEAGDPASRLLKIAEERLETNSPSPLFLLELADLP